MATQQLYWKSGKAQPYLWDANLHEYVNGAHVLYSDGRVVVETDVPKGPGQ